MCKRDTFYKFVIVVKKNVQKRGVKMSEKICPKNSYKNQTIKKSLFISEVFWKIDPIRARNKNNKKILTKKGSKNVGTKKTTV